LYFSPFFFIHPLQSALPILSIKFPSLTISSFSLNIAFGAASTSFAFIVEGASRGFPRVLLELRERRDESARVVGDFSDPEVEAKPKRRVERLARSWREVRGRGRGMAPSESRRRPLFTKVVSPAMLYQQERVERTKEPSAAASYSFLADPANSHQRSFPSYPDSANRSYCSSSTRSGSD